MNAYVKGALIQCPVHFGNVSGKSQPLTVWVFDMRKWNCFKQLCQPSAKMRVHPFSLFSCLGFAFSRYGLIIRLNCIRQVNDFGIKVNAI